MQPKLIITFDKYNEPAFLAKGELIDNNLGSAPCTTLFPAPWPAAVPPPATLHTSFLAYQASYNSAQGGDGAKITARVTARLALTAILKKIAPYLELVAAGNVNALEATGYDLRRTQVRHNVHEALATPANFAVRRGTLSGVLVAKCSKLKGAGSYIVQLCTGDPAVEANWADAVISTLCSRIELTGLTPGRIYHVRMCGLGSNGRGAWTNPVSLMVV